MNAFSGNAVIRDSSKVRLVLDALYPQIRVGTAVVIVAFALTYWGVVKL